MMGPLMTGPLESPELPELTEIMEGAVEIFLWRVAGEAGIVQVYTRDDDTHRGNKHKVHFGTH